METEMKEGRRPKSIKKLMKEGKVDLKELKQLKKERKAAKETKLLARLEQSKGVLEAAKPVPKNMVKAGEVKVGRKYTVSIAVPGSILDNAQTPELRTYLAGQVARAAAIYNVDEVIVFSESAEEGRGGVQLARILQYLECPQYLRKHFFPLHEDLSRAGLLAPTDMPHHLRAGEESVWREGVVTETAAPREGSAFVNIGLKTECLVDRALKPGLRVTVKLPAGYLWDKKISGKVVSPSQPRTLGGLYWGYTTRLADSLSAVLNSSPYKGGYDMTIGTSEKGVRVEEVVVDKFEHLLVVFGGVGGLEAALEGDGKLEAASPAGLFRHYVNVCPEQGSRTIRTEEALLVALASLRPAILAAGS